MVKTLKVAMTALGTGAVVVALTVLPVTTLFASTPLNVPSTQVASVSPISAGPTRSECLKPNFTDTGLASLQAAVTGFESLTNSSVSCVLAYLDSATTWAEWDSPWITDSSYGYTSWIAEAPQTRQLVLAVDLIPSSLEDAADPSGWEQSCADGNFDAYATQLGANLVAAGLGNSIIRLGDEMNGTWEPDFMGTTTQDQNLWANCFANEVTALRQAAGESFLIDWDPNAGKGGYPYANFYPGNSYVNIVGLDLYDVDSNTPNTSVTFSQLANEPYGLTYFEEFAAAHDKPMSFPEWGLSTVPSGDDPGYIDGMGSTVANDDVAFESYFDGATSSSGSLALGSNTPLSVTAFQEWFGAPLSAAATISGTVTADGSGGLAGICVEAFLNGTQLAATASTTTGGAYVISGLTPGSYGVFFLPGCGGGDFATQWYDGATSGSPSAPGTLVATSVASPATGINAAMAAGTSVSGIVSAAVGGADIANICVSTFPAGATTSVGTAGTSATDGAYSILGLSPGNYDVEFTAGACGGSYVTQWYNDTPSGASSISGAQVVTVTVASPATGVNAVMAPSTSISGTVDAAASGVDIGNMCVWAYPVGGGTVQKATTALDGMYTIAGLAAGSYNVEFYTFPCGGRSYVTQWYSGSLTGAPSASGASAVSVTAPSPAFEVNAQLALAASISGTVSAVVGGSAVDGVCVSASSTDGGLGASTTTAADGTYTLLGLEADSYRVVADPTCGGAVTSSYASPQPISTAVTVTIGEALTYNVGLVAPGSISDVITPSIAPANAAVGGPTYSPNATATSGDRVTINLNGMSSGCVLGAGVVSFTTVGTCVIDFNDPSSGASDAYRSAVQVQQNIIVGASTGGASGGGSGGSSGSGGSGGSGGGSSGSGQAPPSPPVLTEPATPVSPSMPTTSVPTPREVTYTGNSTALSAAAKNVLIALAKRLSAGGSVTVTGYAHDNMALARKRADTVATFLVHHVSVHVTIKIVTTSTSEKVM